MAEQKNSALMFKKTGIMIIYAVMFILFSSAVFADDNGYMVKMKDDVLIPLSDERIEEVYAKENIYLTDREKAEEMMNNGLVEYIEENGELELLADNVNYNDTYYNNQWYFRNPYLQKIRGKDGEKVRIAVIDSGIKRDHEDLSGATIYTGYNYIADSTDTTDTLGHGTQVIGMIAADENNGKGIVGINQNTEIVPLVVHYNGKSTIAALVKAIYEAYDKYECRLMNISLGTENDSIILREAVEYVMEKDCILVAAAGNSAVSTYMYPASYDGVISVGWVDKNLEYYYKSHYNDKIFVTAPGVGIYTLKNDGGYALSIQGSSFAAPYVTGVISYALAKYPNAGIDDIREAIKKTSIDNGDVGYDIYYGWGVIDPVAFMQFLDDKYIVTTSESTSETTSESTTESTSESTTESTSETTTEGVIGIYGEDEGSYRIDVYSGGEDIVIAVYDENGTPICIKNDKIENKYEVSSFFIKCDIKEGNIMKIFIFDDLEKMKLRMIETAIAYDEADIVLLE
ncbi:MAG: S8 family serine peptidase [Firmicutes bacterium]|nr:S8 family serine peptidase [Bacillota bacterium]